MAVDTAAVDIVIGSAVAHGARSKVGRLTGRVLVSLAVSACVQVAQIVTRQIVRGHRAVVAFRRGAL